MTSSPKTHLYERVALLVNQGKSPEQISNEIDCPIEKVRWAKASARRRKIPVKDFPKRRNKRMLYNLLLGRGSRLGTLSQAVEILEPEIQEWLATQVPDGATLAQLLTSIVIDTYHDDVDSSFQ